jgi:hypothetical protein
MEVAVTVRLAAVAVVNGGGCNGEVGGGGCS